MANKPYVVVVGTDFSEHADRALRAACEQAIEHAPAELHVVHVTYASTPQPVLSPTPAVGFMTVPILSLEEQRAELQKYLDAQLALVPSLVGAAVRVFAHVVVDMPSLGLTRVAADLDAALLVVGTHGLHGVARWLLGSVAEAVVRQAPCAVLVIPPEPNKLETPQIEPPCPRCVQARRESNGAELWCATHRERHGRRHTYYERDRGAAETNLPLVV